MGTLRRLQPVAAALLPAFLLNGCAAIPRTTFRHNKSLKSPAPRIFSKPDQTRIRANLRVVRVLAFDMVANASRFITGLRSALAHSHNKRNPSC